MSFHGQSTVQNCREGSLFPSCTFLSQPLIPCFRIGKLFHPPKRKAPRQISPHTENERSVIPVFDPRLRVQGGKNTPCAL